MTTLAHWQSLAAQTPLPTHNVIGGKAVNPASDQAFIKYNPANGAPLAEIGAGSAADVDAAVAVARAAFDDGRWSDTSAAVRKQVLYRLADLLEAQADTFALLEVLDVGKPIRDALAVDVPLAASILRYCAEGVDKVFGVLTPGDADTLSYSMRQPVGVVGGIVGWNFPLVLAAQKIGPALAMGNTLVLKPSELSSFSAVRLAELALEAGLPEGVLNVVLGLGPSVGHALSHHMDVDMLSFTGSSATGRALITASGQSNMKRMLLECGGKAANIVFEDCPDLDAVADGVMAKMFWNQGQVCTAGTRLVVERGIRDALLAKLKDRIGAIQAGDPLDPETTFGALISEGQMTKVLGYIDAGREQSADLLIGGQRVRTDSGGYFVEPTLFDGVTTDMRIAREEIFGPVLSVLPFSGPEEAAEIANATMYGLSGTIWTTDVTRAHRTARRLRAGEVTVNATATPTPGAAFAAMPLQPWKQSGVGVESGIEGLKTYTNLKSVQVHF